MKIDPHTSNQLASFQAMQPPKAGGKPLKLLLNLNASNLPAQKSVFSRKIEAATVSHGFYEQIRIIALRSAILNATTLSELDALKNQVDTLTSEEDIQRLYDFIEKHSTNIT